MEVFLESVAQFLGQNKYTNRRKFWEIFRHKIRVFSLQKYSFEYNDHNVYLTKAKSGRVRIETDPSEYLTTKNLQFQHYP